MVYALDSKNSVIKRLWCMYINYKSASLNTVFQVDITEQVLHVSTGITNLFIKKCAKNG